MSTDFKLSPEAQAWADAAIDAIPSDGLAPDKPILLKLQDWLDAEGRLISAMADETNHVWILSFNDIVQQAYERYEGDDTNASAVLAHVRSLARAGFSGSEEYWHPYDEMRWVAAPLRHSSGRQAFLCFQFFSSVSVDQWHGLFESREAYIDLLRREGDVGGIAEFDSIEDDRILKQWHLIHAQRLVRESQDAAHEMWDTADSDEEEDPILTNPEQQALELDIPTRVDLRPWLEYLRAVAYGRSYVGAKQADARLQREGASLRRLADWLERYEATLPVLPPAKEGASLRRLTDWLALYEDSLPTLPPFEDLPR